MKNDDLILPFNGYAVDVYVFDGRAEMYLEKVHAVCIWLKSIGIEDAGTGNIVRSVFYSGPQRELVESFYVDDKFNIFNSEDNLILIENDSLLSALRNLCDHLSQNWKLYSELKVESIGFSFGAMDRTFSLVVEKDVEQ